MSATSIQQSFTKVPNCTTAFPLSVEAHAKTPTDILIEASGILPGDHVMVVGRSVSDHLVGLAHHGCATATGALPDSLFLRMEAADVVWFTGVTDAEGQLAALLPHIGSPRLVALELLGVGGFDGVRNSLRRLAAQGLVHCSYHRAEERLVVTVSRPKWLRWVA